MRFVEHAVTLCTIAAGLVASACGDDAIPVFGSAPPLQQEARAHRAALGVGVDYAETKTFRRCVTVPSVATPHAFEKRLYIEKSVNNRSELDSSMHVDASVSAKGFWGSGSGSFSYFKDVKMTSDAFYWLVLAEYKLRDEGIDLGSAEFHLTPEALEILNGPRGLTGFYEACGDYFYSANSLGAKYSLLYEFQSKEEKTIDKIRAGASYGGFGVEAKASFERLMAMAQKASALNIHVESTGGGDSLRSFATNPEQLENELSRLRDDIYSHEKGVVTEWMISDYNMFAAVQAAKAREMEHHRAEDIQARVAAADLLAKDRALELLYRLYHRNVDYHTQLTALYAAATSDEPLYGYTGDDIKKIEKRLTRLERGTVAIAQAARECIVGLPQDCQTERLNREFAFSARSVKHDFPPANDYTGLDGWEVRLVQNESLGNFVNFSGRLHTTAGEPPIFAFFDANTLVADSQLGMLAPANRGYQYAQIVGQSKMVVDPTDGQMRPYVCVYEYADRCSLRIVPLGKGDRDPGHVKLQMVLFDDDGFVAERLNFPKSN